MKITAKKLRELCDQHLQRYQQRLDLARSGKSGFREKELVVLLSLWKEVQAKKYRYDLLTQDAKIEVDDAMSEEE